MARIRINTRTHTKEKPYLIIRIFFFKIGKAQKCAGGIFATFPWWLKNVKSRSKIVLFSNERHFEIWFPKKRTVTFFWSKLSKLHKKDPILHVATTFSLKQGETRTSHGPIPHPLTWDFLFTKKLKLTVYCFKTGIVRQKSSFLSLLKTFIKSSIVSSKYLSSPFEILLFFKQDAHLSRVQFEHITWTIGLYILTSFVIWLKLLSTVKPM